jgi:hypothetical protein
MSFNGATVDAHLAVVAKRLGRPVAPALVLPPGVGYLWAAFVRMDARRGGGGMGPSPLTWSDFQGFMATTGLELTAWEIETIEALDDAYMGVQADEARSPTKRG